MLWYKLCKCNSFQQVRMNIIFQCWLTLGNWDQGKQSHSKLLIASPLHHDRTHLGDLLCLVTYFVSKTPLSGYLSTFLQDRLPSGFGGLFPQVPIEAPKVDITMVAHLAECQRGQNHSDSHCQLPSPWPCTEYASCVQTLRHSPEQNSQNFWPH